MNWIESLGNAFPILLVLSAATGCVMTAVAARFQRELIRPLGFSNCICTVLLVAVAAWQLRFETSAERHARTLTPSSSASKATLIAEHEALNRQVDRLRAERIGRRWFVIDGLNFWSVFLLSLLTTFIVGQLRITAQTPATIIPSLLLFEGCSIAALTAYDIRAYLISYTLAVLVVAQIMGLWGGSARRVCAARFLSAQLCGSALLMYGFAMLVVAVPWMKLEDSVELPARVWNCVSITLEIQRWTTNNHLAFQYVNEELPWILLILSLGFGLQFGMFPAQRTLTSVLSDLPPLLAVMTLAGVIMASGLGWMRFVLPLAPELLVLFYWPLGLVASAGAIWCILSLLASHSERDQIGKIFASITCLCLLGGCTFTRAGYCGTWLLLQQATTAACVALMLFERHPIENVSGSPREDSAPQTVLRMLFLLIVLIGNVASGFLLLSELLRDGLVLTGMMFLGQISLACILVTRLLKIESRSPMTTGTPLCLNRSRTSFVLCTVLLIVTHLLPWLMLAQCDIEFSRIFRRFEVPTAASSAEAIRSFGNIHRS